jgi:hypothetical protein
VFTVTCLQIEKAKKLKKRLNESESQRLVVISENNKIIFGLNSQCTKMRADLEKSEALRQSLEYETSLLKGSLCLFIRGSFNQRSILFVF